ncbi:MAG: LLM class F420-dependent oxidoreductase [Pseudomonadales bacterium]
MKLGLSALMFGKRAEVNMDLILLAEKLGFDSTWTAEAYGNDAVTTATWIAAHTSTIKVGTAIMQMPARTPAMTAMTAMSLDHLSGGRFLVGLGPSGPQVVEGWHGVPYGKPLTRTKEYIKIMRMIFEREGPLEFHGSMYDIPNTGEGTTGFGKPLKSILHGNPKIPIYTASISPAGIRCSAEVADGVFPMMLDPDKYDDVILPYVNDGFAKAEGNKTLADFDVAPAVSVVVSDDLDAARMLLKPNMALYIGGMGARGKNFYNDYVSRMGFEAEAVKIQDLYLGGKVPEAVAAVPDELVDAVHLVGTKGRIRERFSAWKALGASGKIKTVIVGAMQPEALEVLAEEML